MSGKYSTGTGALLFFLPRTKRTLRWSKNAPVTLDFTGASVEQEADAGELDLVIGKVGALGVGLDPVVENTEAMAGGGIVDRVDHVEEVGLRHFALSVKKTGAFLGSRNAFSAFLYDRIFEYLGVI